MTKTFRTFFSFLICLCTVHLGAGEVDLQSDYTIDSDWGTGYNATLTLTNNSAQEVTEWSAEFELPPGQLVTSLWNGNYQISGSVVTVTNSPWNGIIAPGASVAIGFGATNTGADPADVNVLSATGAVQGTVEEPVEEPEETSFLLNSRFAIPVFWDGGFFAVITLENQEDVSADDWLVEFDLPEGSQDIQELWGASYSVDGLHVTLANPDCHEESVIAPNESHSIAMMIQTASGSNADIFNLQAVANGTFVEAPALETPSLTAMDPVDGNYELSWIPNQQAVYTLEEAQPLLSPEYTVVYHGSDHSFSVAGRSPGAYEYRVRAENGSDVTEYSNVVSVVVPQEQITLDAPSFYPVEVFEDDSHYRISWTNVADASLYVLEESGDSSFSSANVVYQGSDTSFEVPSQSQGTYYYRVLAKDGANLSPYSEYLTVTVTEQSSTIQHKVIGYFPNWGMYREQPLKPENLNGQLITHLNYAFTKVTTDGTIQLYDPWADVQYRDNWNEERPFWGHFKQLQDLKEQNPHLKTLISVGGWTLSDTFSELADSEAARNHFADQCVWFCQQYGFDGIDIDWEYPGFAEHSGRPVDQENFTLLLQTVSQRLKAESPSLLLTIAAPAGPWHYENMNVDEIHQYLDWVNLMTYDFHGPWGGEQDAVTNHHAALYPPTEGDSRLCVSEAVQYYLEQGVPAEKLVVGVPLYGRSYAGVDGSADGLGGTFTGVGTGTTAELGVLFYDDIVRNLLGQYTQHWDATAQVPYLYDEVNKEFVSYENEQSLQHKCSYIRDHRLGGIMFWELGMDTRPEWDMLRLMNRELNVQTASK